MKPSGSATRFRGGPGEVEREPPVVQAADVETDRARIDAHDARHRILLSSATSSRATSAIVSASSTRSLRANSRATQALCSFVLKLPTPNAPRHVDAVALAPASLTSTPSMPSGGTALRSTATFRSSRPVHADFGTSCTPAGPELSSTSAPFEQLRQLRRVGQRGRLDLDVEARADELPRLLALLRLARGDGHVGAVLREQARRALAHRPGARQDQRPSCRAGRPASPRSSPRRRPRWCSTRWSRA